MTGLSLRSYNSLRALLLLLTFFTAHTPAQTVVESNIPGAGFDEPASDVPTIQVFSREVLVDVTVTDDQGNAVHGLKQSDFTIEENGHPQSIRGFREFGAQTDTAPTSPKLPPNTYTNLRSMPTSGPVNIILLDVFHSDPTSLVRAKEQIESYLKSMPTGTQIAVFDLSPSKGLLLVQPFTSDGNAAAAAVDTIDVEWNRPPPKVDSIAALNVVAAYVSGIHGKKNLLWFAPSTPVLLVRDGGYSWGESDMAYVHRVMDVYERFTEEQIAVCNVGISGVAENNVPRGGALFNVPFIPAQKMEAVAEATGGEAFYNTNDLKGAIAKAIDDGSQYYSISYIPPRQKDDSHYHSIQVKLTRPGLHLLYRNGYNSEEPVPVTPASKLQMTQASMGLGALPSTQLLFTLQVTPSQTSEQRTGPLPKRAAGRRQIPTAAGKTNVAYDLLYKLDQTQISFSVTKDGTHTASLEFDLAAYNADGKVITVRSQTLKLPLTPAEYLDFIQIPFQFYLSIDLPPGPVSLRAGVFDGNTNRAGTIEIPLTVAKK